MSNIPSVETLMKAGVHFGHQKSKWHPKMKPFIYIEKNGVHIINLEQTQKLLEKALGFIEKTVQNNGTVLFLGTKRQAQGLVKEAALSCDMPYVVTRWLGGTLTNATSVLGLAKKYRKLKEDKASGKLDKFTKKEKLTVTREIERLEDIVGGISKLERIPNVIFVVDVKHEKTAVQEAIRKGVPVVAICDSNVNPDKIDYPIPGNDDATKAIELFVKLVADKINEAKQADTTKNTKNK
jgi:small subunit ribosomal protein S2